MFVAFSVIHSIDVGSWLSALFAVLGLLVFGIVAGDGGDGGEGGDGGDGGDPAGGDGGNPDDMPSPAPGAWRGEGNNPNPNPNPNPNARAAGTAGNPNPNPNPNPAPNPDLVAAQRRITELEAQFNDLGARHRHTQRMLATAAGIPGPSEPKTPEDARREKLLNQFIDLFPKDKQPHIKRLLIESPDKLAAVLDADPERSPGEERHWQGVARSTSARVWDEIAPALMGTGKTGVDLDDETRADLKDSFARWINRDKTGARADRYEQQDPALVKEFAAFFKGRFIDPGRRTAATNLINRGNRTANLPVGGGGNQAVRQPLPKPPDTSDDDAVHKSGWAVAQSLRNGT